MENEDWNTEENRKKCEKLLDYIPGIQDYLAKESVPYTSVYVSGRNQEVCISFRERVHFEIKDSLSEVGGTTANPQDKVFG